MGVLLAVAAIVTPLGLYGALLPGDEVVANLGECSNNRLPQGDMFLYSQRAGTKGSGELTILHSVCT